MPLSSYDAWVTRDPYDDWPEPWELLGHCEVCGGWLSHEPESWEEQVAPGECNGRDPEYGTSECDTMGSDFGTCPGTPHAFTMYGGIVEKRTCGNCGTVNERLEW